LLAAMCPLPASEPCAHLWQARATGQQVAPSASSAPPHALAPEALGDLLMAKRQYVAAIKAYGKVPGNSAVIWNKMGIAWQHLYATDKAQAAYRRALRIRPHYPEALNNLGTIYYGKKNYGKAEKFYRKAIKLQPRSATFYNNLGAAYFAQDKIKQGVKAYEAAFAIDPSIFSRASTQGIAEIGSLADEANQSYCLAEIFARAGMPDRAIEYLRKAIAQGFSDRRRIMKDRSFAQLRNTPAFEQLLEQKKKP
jgi:tetratricopeptide (TPR) repeat protein